MGGRNQLQVKIQRCESVSASLLLGLYILEIYMRLYVLFYDSTDAHVYISTCYC